MRLRHIGALIANDLRVHGPAIGLTGALLLAFIWFAGRHRNGAGALLILIVNLNFLMALLWGDWLISREKLKGTFGWLRTLPVSDRDLVAAKFMTAAICGATLWLTAGLGAPRLLQTFRDQPIGQAVAAGAMIAVAGLVFLFTERWVRRSDTFRLLE